MPRLGTSFIFGRAHVTNNYTSKEAYNAEAFNLVILNKELQIFFWELQLAFEGILHCPWYSDRSPPSFVMSS